MNGQSPLAPVREGEVLAGKYCVERILGVGGMGVVVAARHIHLGQQVALKFLLPDACQHADAVARFVREARACVRMQGEHVTRVTDVGTLENGAPYMVMEFLHGIDVERLVEQRGPLPITEAVGYVLQACEAIAEAHALGIIHRDLKPRNLFLTQRPDGSPLIKVLDFGISKIIDPLQTDSAVTATAVVLGSPLYMSPEQVRNAKAVDTRTDIWSLGVILFQLLTGRVPYEAPTLSGLLAAIVADPPSSVRAFRADIPSELEQVVMRCIEKDLAKRIATVGRLARDLGPFASSTDQISVQRILRLDRTMTGAKPPGHGDTSVQGLAAPSGGSQGTVSAWAESQVKNLGRRWVAGVGAAGLLAIVATVIALAVYSGPSDPAEQPQNTGTPHPSAVATTTKEGAEGRAEGIPMPASAVRGSASSTDRSSESGQGTTVVEVPRAPEVQNPPPAREIAEPAPQAASANTKASAVRASSSALPAARPQSASPAVQARPGRSTRPASSGTPRKRDRARDLFNDIN